jgi:acyl-CoA thioester hydrolase
MPTRQKIRYADCDPQAIVFNGNYPKYWDDAVTDWFEEKGYGGQELGGSGVDVLTARLEIDFRSAGRLGDTLETSVAVEGFGRTSMAIAIETRRHPDGDLVAEGRQVLVFVDPETHTPVEVPEEIKVGLSAESNPDG